MTMDGAAEDENGSLGCLPCLAGTGDGGDTFGVGEVDLWVLTGSVAGVLFPRESCVDMEV